MRLAEVYVGSFLPTWRYQSICHASPAHLFRGQEWQGYLRKWRFPCRESRWHLVWSCWGVCRLLWRLLYSQFERSTALLWVIRSGNNTVHELLIDMRIDLPSWINWWVKLCNAFRIRFSLILNSSLLISNPSLWSRPKLMRLPPQGVVEVGSMSSSLAKSTMLSKISNHSSKTSHSSSTANFCIMI